MIVVFQNTTGLGMPDQRLQRPAGADPTYFVPPIAEAMRSSRLRFSTRALLGGVLLVAVVLGAVSMYPRTTTLAINDRWTGYYTGLGVADTNDFLGFNFYEFRVDDSPYRIWTISNERLEYNTITGYYPDGAACLIGTCRIEGEGRDLCPLIDALGSATSYRPDGTIAAVMQDGNGESQLFYPSGQLQWEATYENYERVSWSHWNEDGTLAGQSKSTDD